MLEAVKLALRITTDAYDEEICGYIQAGLADMGIAGVVNNEISDPLVMTAVITYVKMRFGSPDEYDRLKASYDEQKGQLGTATGYTDWGRR